MSVEVVGIECRALQAEVLYGIDGNVGTIKHLRAGRQALPPV